MSIEEQIKETILDANKPLVERLQRVESLLELLTGAIVVPQNKACEIAEVDRGTIRRKVKTGDVQPLSTDTSRRNYFTITQVKNLKAVKRRAQKRS